MTILKKIYNSLYNHTWELGFLENTLEDIVSGANLNYVRICNNDKNRWFADPFILEVNDSEVILLCEEYNDRVKRGRIAKVVIDRLNNQIKEWKLLLDLNTHLSFPVIKRIEGRIYVYPENSEGGVLNLYEYNKVDDKLIPVKTICDKPLTDAIITVLEDRAEYIFSTYRNNPNGKHLAVLQYMPQEGVYQEKMIVNFDENIARMAGNFFCVDKKIYRPAQESNKSYGHSIDIQELIIRENSLEFKSIRRIESPHPTMKLGFHTINEHNGVIVVDVKGYRHPTIVKILTILKSLVGK